MTAGDVAPWVAAGCATLFSLAGAGYTLYKNGKNQSLWQGKIDTRVTFVENVCSDLKNDIDNLDRRWDARLTEHARQMREQLTGITKRLDDLINHSKRKG